MNLVETPFFAKASGGPGRLIGNIFVDTGRLSSSDVAYILGVQKEDGKRFGEIAIDLGLLCEDDIRFALSSQFEYPYLTVDDTSLSHELVAAYQPFSPVVEQLRALRSQLMLRWFDAVVERKTLAVVSPGKGEGRSFMAANLAIVFAQLGQRTLLVDADMRNPRQHELFRLGNRAGLSGILAGRAGVEAIMPVRSLQTLSVLPAGAVPPNPQELLGRPVFIETLYLYSRDFDVVIMDTPAGSEYADAQTIAARAGAALVLAKRNQTSLSDIAQLTRNLRQSDATLVGAVLNDG
jgi:chain length determinant protein tyrosine kinase EpsG